MSSGYWWGTGVVVALYFLVLLAAYLGWGLASDERPRSVRSGGLHQRHIYGGGPGFGK